MDVAGFTRLTEKAIWEAIIESGVEHVDWVIQKVYADGKPYFHLFMELSNGCTIDEAKILVHSRLVEKDAGYADMQEMLGYDPLKLSLLPSGAFSRYTETMRANGADLAHLKPPRINPSNEIVELLVKK